MIRQPRRPAVFRVTVVAAVALLGAAAPLQARHPTTHNTDPIRVRNDGIDVPMAHGTLMLRMIGKAALHVHYRRGDGADAATLVMAPGSPPAAGPGVHVQRRGNDIVIAGGALYADYASAAHTLQLRDARGGAVLLRQADLSELDDGRIVLQASAGAALYGVHGFTAFEHDTSGLLRDGEMLAQAGEQGNAGAPLVWSTEGFGVLVDTMGARFDLKSGRIAVDRLSREPDYYLIAGSPRTILGEVSALSGRPPLFPKWAMGFTNSQWGIDQRELLDIVHTYRRKHIPIDNFTLDFDWKAWGEDDYGEFRWNAKNFPDGPGGRLKHEMDALGVHMTGIMKPRIHLDTVEGRYATAHDFWSPASQAQDDYFSHKSVRELDFDKPAVRAWFFNDALKHAFDTGIVGWWNDEADDIHSNTQFTNMQRALYAGQRAYSPLRVWSINRNFYLGAQRYAYGLWSGDIHTGFDSMAAQRERMLSAINVGEMQWGMDGGGFHGHPSAENYARWIQFGAFTPIFRVHGEHFEKRQPWRYGPIAEKAATAAMRLRYTLIPYVYAYAWHDHADGIGLVRPLIFDWPHDPAVRNDVSAWMFGDWLLVSPVVHQGATRKRIYLPAGEWTDWFSGKRFTGGRTITRSLDAQHWSDIPLYVRQGAIIPTQPAMDYVGEKPLVEVGVEVFPTAATSRFDYYDDDGSTYDYQHGAYFLQTLTSRRDKGAVHFAVSAAKGSFKPALRTYLLKLHGVAATAVADAGKPLRHYKHLAGLQHADNRGWARGHDRFGAVTYVRVTAGKTHALRITATPERTHQEHS